jgi:hypothetical protein
MTKVYQNSLSWQIQENLPQTNTAQGYFVLGNGPPFIVPSHVILLMTWFLFEVWCVCVCTYTIHHTETNAYIPDTNMELVLDQLVFLLLLIQGLITHQGL